MVERREDLFSLEIGQQLAHVATQPLNLAVLDFVDAEHPEMHPDIVVRKDAGDLARDDDVGAIGDRQYAFDAVVVGDGDQVHAALFRAAVDAVRRVIGLAEEMLERCERGAPGKRRVHVRIEFHDASNRRRVEQPLRVLVWARATWKVGPGRRGTTTRR